MREGLAVEVKDSVLDPDSTERTVRVRNAKSEHPLYQVFLYLDGPDLPFVRGVTYELHPTFPERVRRVARTVSNPRCKLVTWMWGLFEAKVIIQDNKGMTYQRTHDLRWDRQLSEKGVKIVET